MHVILWQGTVAGNALVEMCKLEFIFLLFLLCGIVETWWHGTLRNLVSCPDPTRQERVWWHLADSSGSINVACFRQRISPANHIVENTICSFLCNAGNSWLLQHDDTSVLNYPYSMLWIFNKAQRISQMSPDPLLTGGVWARDYMRPLYLYLL